MAVNVNPPPALMIPKRFAGDREAVAFFDQQRTILFQLWQRTGGTNDLINNNESEGFNFLNSFLQQNTRAIAGLPEFTVDTTGFTTDTTKITTDKVTA